jgi:hypothetical protein
MGEAQRHANEARLKLLETQLEPHMLFNTLANLRALIGVDPNRAQEMLDHMIAYLRATLNASRAATHPLQAEFDRLRDYLELMAIRMGPRIKYTLDLPPELAAHPVPALLLQPLVENSIQHGLEPKVGGGSITVSARVDAGRLLLEVADTGVGNGDAPQGGKGFGMAQVRERLAAVYGNAATFEFQAESGQGARTRIVIPLQPHEGHRRHRRRRTAAGAGAAAELAQAWPELRSRRQRGRRRLGRAQALRTRPTCCSSTSACRARAAWKPRPNWPTNGRRARPSPRWCSSPPTTSTRCRRSRRRRSTTC